MLLATSRRTLEAIEPAAVPAGSRLFMALPSAAAPASEAQQEDVTHNAEAKPAEAAISQEASHKQGTASEPQAAPMQAVQAVELQLAPQPASQQLANSSAAAAQSLPVPPTATAPHTDAAPSDGTQMTAQAESPKATGIHNTLDIVCADVQGVLTLDFKSMRCFILYKGEETLLLSGPAVHMPLSIWQSV